MKLLLVSVLALLVVGSIGSPIPGNPITTTNVGSTIPVATSYQVTSRNVNRILVPHVPTVRTTAVAYPGVDGVWYAYPYNYHYGYADYGYPYGYQATVLQ